MLMALYYVDVFPIGAACTDTGHTFDIHSPTRASAISQARRLVRAGGYYTRQDGPLVYTARQAGRL